MPSLLGAEAVPSEPKAEPDKAQAEEKTDEPKAEAKEEAKADEKKEEEKKEETTDYRNWFDVTMSGTIVDGNEAAFQRRYGLPSGPFGGVEQFHYEQDVGKKGLFTVDGRGVFDNHDYSLKFDVSHPDIGYVRGGYREFRSYYDGSGGYFHPTGAWVTPFDDELALDRGDFFFETGLTLPNKPNVSFRYDHQFRNGEKDSTAWGDLTIPGYGIRKLVPGFYDIDETRDIFAFDVKHTLWGTTFGAGLRYELSENDDSRNMLRNPGEATARYGTDREKVEDDMFNVHVFSETPFTEKVLFTSGYSFTTLDGDVSGYRLYGATYDPVFAQRLPAADTFESLSGTTDLQQHVANLNVMWQLADALVLVPSLRIEQEGTDNDSIYGSPAAPFTSSAYDAGNDRSLLDVAENLELRYTGLTNWVFYTRGEWLQGSGDLSESWNNLSTGANVLDRSTDSERFWQTYTAGANWYPLRKLNFGVQYFHKERSTEYDHETDSTPNTLVGLPSSLYPAFLNAQSFSTDDANFRMTWRALPKLTLVARYDFQYSTIDTTPDSTTGLSEHQASKMVSHIIGGTANWTPLQRLYIQAGANVVFDDTETPAADITPAVQNFNNDYWTINSAIGYALDNKTDLELQYLWYRADNFQDNSAYGVPYGADAQEYGITAGLVHRFSPRLRGTLRYGYFDGTDSTSGHENDYHAHLISTSLHYRF